MQVILKEDVEKLGKIGDVVVVSDGYARNFLIPKNLATEATPRNMKRIEHEKRLIAEKLKKATKEAENFARRLNEIIVTIPVQTGEGDKLFGSVTTMDIASALEKEGITVERKKILLENLIKELGAYIVPVKIHPEVTANLKVQVVKA